jgi:endo-1,4-beta-D-glucanase Y
MHALYNGGASDSEVKVALAIAPAGAISNDLWDDLQDRYPEFSEVVQEGHMLAEAWWTKQGRRALFLPEGVKFNALTYVFCMTNRFANYRRNPTTPPLRSPQETDSKTIIYIPENGR